MLLSKLLKKYLPLCLIVLMLSSNSFCSQAQPDTETQAQWSTALVDGNIEKTRQILDQFPGLLHTQDSAQLTPLGRAALHDHLHLAQFLLRRGAHIEAPQQRQATPLHIACFSLSSSAQMVEFLIENGSDIHARNQDGDTPLHWCRYVARARLLIEHGADITVKNRGGLLPIHVAANHNFIKLLTYYLDIKPDIVDALTRINRTSLSLAVLYGQEESAEALLQAGANINAQDCNGLAPLHIASREDHDTFVKLLLRWDSDVHAEDNKGKKPLLLAAEDGYFRNRNPQMPSYTPEQRITQRRAAVKALLEYGVPIESAEEVKLIRALQSRDFDPGKIILDTHAQASKVLCKIQTDCDIQALPSDLENLILTLTATPKLPTEKRKRTAGSESEVSAESKKPRV